MKREEWVAHLNRKRTEEEMWDCQKAWINLQLEMENKKYERMKQEAVFYRQEKERLRVLTEKAVFGGPRL